MNEFCNNLLKLAYDNYTKTNNLECEFLFGNGNELFNYLSAARSLHKLGYIIVLSDIVSSNKMSLLKDLPVCYELTQEGIDYCRNKFS